MKTVHKLVLKSYLGPMILTFFIVMFVLIMQFMWRYIDELVGKGLDMSVIGELMFWAAMTLIPMGLPLATLLAAHSPPADYRSRCDLYRQFLRRQQPGAACDQEDLCIAV